MDNTAATGIMVIWTITIIGLILMVLVAAWGTSQRYKPKPTKPTYRELTALAVKHGLPPGDYAMEYNGRRCGFIVGEHCEILPDPIWGKYWR